MNFRDWNRRTGGRLPAAGDMQAKQQAHQRFQNDARALRQMIGGWPMIKCADGSRRFVPQFHFGNSALKPGRLNDERRLLIRLNGNLFRAKTARRRFLAAQPETRGFRLHPVGFAETPGSSGDVACQYNFSTSPS